MAKATRRSSAKKTSKAGSKKRAGRTTAARGKAQPRRATASKPRRRAPSVPMLRTSERSTFKACRWQWERGYVDRLTPHEDAPALRFGSLVHAALELRYPPGIKRGPHPARTFERLFEEELREAENTWGFRDSDGEWADAGQLGVNMLEHFVETYGRDEEWRVIESEMTFQVPVYGKPAPEDSPHVWTPADPEEDEDAVLLFYYVGTMDNVLQNRMDDSVFVHDWKTTKGDPEKEAMGKLLLDEQGTAYWTWGVDWLLEQGIMRAKGQAKGHPNVRNLNGMLYTFLRKQAKDTRPQNAQGQYLNKDGSVSQRQPGKYFHRELIYRDLEQQERARQRVLDEFADMQAVRQGKAPAYKSPGLTFPSQQCKGCAFFDVCELHEIGADWETLRDSTFKQWDPYAAHEIREENKR